MRALALASLVLTGCNALFGLSEAELREGASSATSTSGSGGGGGAASSSSSGGTGAGDATSSSAGGGGGEPYVGCADMLGTGGGGGSCVIVEESRFTGESLAGWALSGTVSTSVENGNAHFRLDVSSGAYSAMRGQNVSVQAGDEICLAARTRINEGGNIAQPHLTAWILGSDPLEHAAELNLAYQESAFGVREARDVVEADGGIYLDLSAQGDGYPSTLHFDADDITLVIRRCN